MAESRQLNLPDPAATGRLGGALASALLACRPQRLVVYLHGGLGTGKTTLVRGCLQGLGHRGRTPSPTYTLVEPYELAGYLVLHADLYRLSRAEEAEHLGLDEPVDGPSLCLIEWPVQGAGRIPRADLECWLDFDAGGARTARLAAATPAGQRLLQACKFSPPDALHQSGSEDPSLSP